MYAFLQRYRVVLSSGVLLLSALFLITGNLRGTHRVDPLGWVLREAAAPFQLAITATVRGVRGVIRGYVDLLHVREENATLRARVRALEEILRGLREIELSHRRLEDLLALRSGLALESQAARVIARDATGWMQTFAIDKGEADGVERGMAVLAAAGAVGRVYVTSAHAARVLLLTNHNSAVDAVVQRTRARGILEGTLGAQLTLKYVERAKDVHAGDRVVTSGLDGSFPKGIPLGQVATVHDSGSGLFQDVTVVPAVDFGKVEEVLIVRAPPDELL